MNTNIKYISHNTSDKLERSQLHGEEVLMVFIGAGTGNVSLVPKGKWHLGPNVAKITLDKIIPEFLNYYLQSPLGQSYIKSKMKATAQQSLSMGTIREILVHLPPIQEQKEIVKKLNLLLSSLDKEFGVINSIDIKSIKQSILSKAFRGELGTNDPDEENVMGILREVIEKGQLNK